MTWLSAVRSILYIMIFYGISVPICLFGLLVAFAGRGATRWYAGAWMAFHEFCVRWILGIRIRVEGVIPDGQVMFAGKHQSHFEAMILPGRLGTPAVVMKRQLTDIPIWGWFARRYGAIAVDRDNGANALRRMLREAQEAIDEGRDVLIFPEGTRVPPGEAPPLQPGFAGLYRRLSVPVVPIAVDSGRLWPRRGLIKRSGIITFRFGEPVPPGLPRAEMEARVHAAMNVLVPVA